MGKAYLSLSHLINCGLLTFLFRFFTKLSENVFISIFKKQFEGEFKRWNHYNFYNNYYKIKKTIMTRLKINKRCFFIFSPIFQ